MTQVDDSGYRIPRDPAGKHRKSLEHGSSIPTANCSVFFRWIPVNFLCFSAGTGRKSSEFFDLINFHHLNGWLKYKEVEMKTLEKVFAHYLKCNEYY
jgi:hypothetical protein